MLPVPHTQRSWGEPSPPWHPHPRHWGPSVPSPCPTGDTLFVGGCGQFFEGTAEQMHTNLTQILGTLPKDTVSVLSSQPGEGSWSQDGARGRDPGLGSGTGAGLMPAASRRKFSVATNAPSETSNSP